jgi:hypothetical protein
MIPFGMQVSLGTSLECPAFGSIHALKRSILQHIPPGIARFAGFEVDYDGLRIRRLGVRVSPGALMDPVPEPQTRPGVFC